MTYRPGDTRNTSNVLSSSMSSQTNLRIVHGIQTKLNNTPSASISTPNSNDTRTRRLLSFLLASLASKSIPNSNYLTQMSFLANQSISNTSSASKSSSFSGSVSTMDMCSERYSSRVTKVTHLGVAATSRGRSNSQTTLNLMNQSITYHALGIRINLCTK